MWLGSETAFCLGEEAFFPHPHLAPKRELLGLLTELLSEGLQVAVALHPFRRARLDEVRPRLLEDYWSGIKTTAENLDSLDAHDVGTPTFHAASDRSAVQKLFNPMLGTWIDWARRSDDASDPVKRLYVREVRPPVNGRGEELVAVQNAELHSERNTAARRFTHVDGKVRRHLTSTYGPSRENPMAATGPFTHSRKLWRVDGPLSDEQWAELVGLHFRGNELVEEHFAAAFPAMGDSPTPDSTGRLAV